VSRKRALGERKQREREANGKQARRKNGGGSSSSIRCCCVAFYSGLYETFYSWSQSRERKALRSIARGIISQLNQESSVRYQDGKRAINLRRAIVGSMFPAITLEEIGFSESKDAFEGGGGGRRCRQAGSFVWKLAWGSPDVAQERNEEDAKSENLLFLLPILTVYNKGRDLRRGSQAYGPRLALTLFFESWKKTEGTKKLPERGKNMI